MATTEASSHGLKRTSPDSMSMIEDVDDVDDVDDVNDYSQWFHRSNIETPSYYLQTSTKRPPWESLSHPQVLLHRAMSLQAPVAHLRTLARLKCS